MNEVFQIPRVQLHHEMQYVLMDIITIDTTNPYNGYYLMVSYHSNISMVYYYGNNLIICLLIIWYI